MLRRQYKFRKFSIQLSQIVLEETRQYFSICKTCFGLLIKPSSVEYRDIRICNNLTLSIEYINGKEERKQRIKNER